MRCRFCGSKSLHEDTRHKNFSAGKAVAGAVTFGAVGAAAGFIGKEKKGYRCGACGAFMDTPMDFFTESQVDSAIRQAESGGSRSLFDYYRGQYANIQANIPAAPAQLSAPAEREVVYLPAAGAAAEEEGVTVKRSYESRRWQPDCPIWVEDVVIKTGPGGDRLSLVAWNTAGERKEEYVKNAVRSVYFQVRVFDDTGDQVAECRCVYQGVNVRPGEKLPEDKEFPLGTDLAYRVELTCEKVAYEGEAVWRAPEELKTVVLPDQPELTRSDFPRLKYADSMYAKHEKRDENGKRIRETKHIRMPMKEEGYWLCDCGLPVPEGRACVRCADRWANVEKVFSQPYLIERQQTAVKKRAAERATAVAARIERIGKERAQEEIDRKNAAYDAAAALAASSVVEDLRGAAEQFEKISGWKDADERAKACRAQADKQEEEERAAAEKRAAEEKRLEEERKAKTKKTLSIVIPVAAVALIALILTVTVFLPNAKYSTAEKLLADGKYDEAIAAFAAMNGQKDSAERAIDAAYAKAEAQIKDGDFLDAVKTYVSLNGARDSTQRAKQHVPYEAALYYIAAADRDDASGLSAARALPAALKKAYTAKPTGTSTSAGAPTTEAAPSNTPAEAAPATSSGSSTTSESNIVSQLLTKLKYYEKDSVLALYDAAAKLADLAQSNGLADVSKATDGVLTGKERRVKTIHDEVYDGAKALYDQGSFTEAAQVFDALGTYRDSADMAALCRQGDVYREAEQYLSAQQYGNAYEKFSSISGYRDSADRAAAAARVVAERYEQKNNLPDAVTWYVRAKDETNADRLRWQYIRDHQDETDVHTYEYLILLKARDDEAKAIYDGLYQPVSVTVRINTDVKDYETNRTALRLPYYNGYVYIHIKYTGGTPDKKTLPVDVYLQVVDAGTTHSSLHGRWFDEGSSYPTTRVENTLTRDKWITASSAPPYVTANDKNNHNFILVIHSVGNAFEDIRIPYSVTW